MKKKPYTKDANGTRNEGSETKRTLSTSLVPRQTLSESPVHLSRSQKNVRLESINLFHKLYWNC
jgi:hypothetical protein